MTNKDTMRRLDRIIESISEFTMSVERMLDTNPADAFIVKRSELEKLTELARAWNTLIGQSTEQLALVLEPGEDCGLTPVYSKRFGGVVNGALSLVKGVGWH